MGGESLIGRIGTVRQPIPKSGCGQVHVAGEIWSAELAEGENPLEIGTRVEVVSIQGVRLKVRAKEKFIQD
jgi:membrane-bound serine protease (ClpP class)